MPQPTLLFPNITTIPTTKTEALSNLFQSLYLQIFMTGYTKKPTSIFAYLFGQKVDAIRINALNFLSTSGDSLLSRNVAQLKDGLVSNTIPHSAIVGLMSQGDLSDPFFAALSEWILLCYTESSAGDVSIPVLITNPDMSITISDTSLTVDVSGDDAEDLNALPPFWRWLSCITIGYSDSSDPFTDICTNILPYVAIPLSPKVMANEVYGKQIPLPNLVNMLISLDALFPTDSTSPVSNDDYRRVMWSRWLRGTSQDLRLVGGDIFIIWSRLFDGIVVGSTWSRLQSALTELAQAIQTVNLTTPYDRAALEAASLTGGIKGISDPSEEPDAATADGDVGSDTSNDIDSTSGTGGGTASLGDPSSVGKDQQSNAIGETGTPAQKAMVQLGDTSTGNPVNAYIYRRAVLAVNKLLETDEDLVVSHDARASLADWCRQWLWVADVSQTQKLMRELGLQKFVTQVKV